MWHASAAIIASGRPKPLMAWTPEDWRRADLALRRVLSGVGTEPNLVQRGDLALHIRRKVTAAEHAEVGPAIDVRTNR